MNKFYRFVELGGVFAMPMMDVMDLVNDLTMNRERIEQEIKDSRIAWDLATDYTVEGQNDENLAEYSEKLLDRYTEYLLKSISDGRGFGTVETIRNKSVMGSERSEIDSIDSYPKGLKNGKPPILCRHCHMDLSIRNPSGYCDHLYYPDNCKICRDEK